MSTPQNSGLALEPVSVHKVCMASEDEAGPQSSDSAERMLRLRTALGGSQTAFCKLFGFKPQRWSNYENGRPVGLPAALNLVRKIPGLTLDWIYFGDSSGLTMEMAKRLGELPTDLRSGT